MLLLLEDNQCSVQLLSHFHVSHAHVSCLRYGIFEAHQIKKFQPFFGYTLVKCRKLQELVLFSSLVAFSTTALFDIPRERVRAGMEMESELSSLGH